ncbi:suppressor APC domain-containing protein 2 isoform X4 [Castor canadensis]|uniref:Suppressor APC domain-containing protein 2 isoform X4 n=1 Tax=Castor canadensis TaxID=51338 RepID=A0AC58KVA7_CASCN
MAVAAMAERGRLPPAVPAPAPSTEGLPRAFLQSLRTLFDILDDRRRGFVHLHEIESRWQGADASELPRGVLEGLRQVAPASGYLTFERFVAGLRTSLLNTDGGPRDPARAQARPGDQRAPPPPQRLVFAPADEPRTVLERKPLPLGARPAPAGPGGSARNPEQLCGPAEVAAGPTEPERPQSSAQERSPSVDAAEADEGAGAGAGGVAAGSRDDGAWSRLVPAAAAACAGAPASPGPKQSLCRLWGSREFPPTGAATAQSTGGGPVPGGAVGCSLRWQGECSGPHSTPSLGHPPALCPGDCLGKACLTMPSHRLCPHPLQGSRALSCPRPLAGSSKPSSC